MKHMTWQQNRSDEKEEHKYKNTKRGGGDKKTKKDKIQEKHRTRHVALHLSYDGTDFTGFGENLRRDVDRSVEKTLFAALEKACLLVLPPDDSRVGMLTVKDEGDEKISTEEKPSKGKTNNYLGARNASQYSRCARTDKGVHAQYQVVALYLKSAFPLSARHTVGQPIKGQSDSGTPVPGDLLQEESLPKNSLDQLECLVLPKRKPKGDNNEDALQRKTIHEYDYPRILNNILPPSIRILGWCPVSPEFSARFSCRRRTYRYFFPRRELHLSAMAEGLRYMIGRHDFRNFCKMNWEKVINFERRIFSGKVVSPQEAYVVSEEQSWPSIEQKDDSPLIPSPHDICHVEIIGDAFLWHQMRCIMSVLFYIGQQLEPPTLVQQLLDVRANPGKPSYAMASETGLVLHNCEFDHLTLGRTVRNLWGATKLYEQRWETHAVAAERAKDALESVKNGMEVRWTDVRSFVEQIARDRMRKEEKNRSKSGGLSSREDDGGEIKRAERELEALAPKTNLISWSLAMQVIRDVLGIHPHLPSGSSGQGQGGKHAESSVHKPLMERSKGKPYEEKVELILGLAGGAKRKARYQENINKKRKTEEEDRVFYDHMLRQGGSSI